jgi:hypothetical protein
VIADDGKHGCGEQIRLQWLQYVLDVLLVRPILVSIVTKQEHHVGVVSLKKPSTCADHRSLQG